MSEMIEETNDEIQNVDLANTFFTPYQCATVVNSWFAEKQIDRELPPQMFYTYTKKGYIASYEVEGKKLVALEDLQKWFVAYVHKNVMGKKVALQIPSAPEL